MAEEKHVCPYCDEELECVLFTDWGAKIWNGKEWEKDDGYGELVFRCPHCGVSIEYPHLEELGVV